MIKKQIKSKSDQVVDEIIKMIMNEEMKPGDRVPTETELSEMFGVSRITIREAFKKLNAMGIMDIRQGEGTFVNTVPPTFCMEPLLPLLVLNERDMEQLYDARLFIEVGLVSLATKHCSEDNLTKLWQTIETMRENFQIKDKENKKIYAQADKEFHDIICHMSHNTYLICIYETITDILQMCINKTSSIVTGREASLSEHTEILKAMINGNADMAMVMTTQHVLNAKMFYMDNVEKKL